MAAITTPEVIVLERCGDWALALRQASQRRQAAATVAGRARRHGEGLTVRETRSADECFQAAVSSAAPLLVVVVDPGRAEPQARLLARLTLLVPRARTVVVGLPNRRELEGAWRELGASEVVYSMCEIDRVMDFIERQFQRPGANSQTVERVAGTEAEQSAPREMGRKSAQK